MTGKREPKLIVHWWEDCCGKYTCHLNERNLSFKESLLGYLELREGSWYYFVVATKLEGGPFRSVLAAKRAFEYDMDASEIEI